MALPKWTEERTAELEGFVGETDLVTVDQVNEAAAHFETTNRSVAAKLRKMGYDVESTAQAHSKSFTDEEEAQLRDFVEANEGVYTYAEIAENVFGDAGRARQVQGKLLSMELTAFVKPTPKKEVVKQYTDAEEATFIKMVEDGAFIEDIAEALGKTINSVRGKALSLTRSAGIEMPKQKESHAKVKVDPLEALGDVSEMTVSDIAEAIGKTERGVKTMLTYRGLVASDYDGAAKAAKNAEKKAAAA